MDNLAVWAGAALLAALALILLWVWLRRHRTRRDDPQWALREMASERKKRSGGTIRGKGQGGSSITAQDAASGSDTGGGI